MPELIQAEYSVVTPLFLGDANKEATDIFPASIKGVLRFYWRALQWGKLRSNQCDEDALEALHAKESQVFGSSAEQTEGIGQAQFNIRVEVDKLPLPKSDWPKSGSDSGYLGMGLWESGRKEKGNFQPARQYLSEGIHFTVKLVLKPSFAKDDIQLLQDALVLLGLIGGLGSRSRRAFGSLALVTLNDKSYQFSSLDEYKNSLIELLNKYLLDESTPPFSAFSDDSKISINTKHEATARKAHADLGYLFKEHRSQPNPKKRVFGMPYSGGGQKEKNARRASPLLMHIHPIGTVFHAVCTYLPATFHYDKSLERVDYDLIENFVEQFDEVNIS